MGMSQSGPPWNVAITGPGLVYQDHTTGALVGADGREVVIVPAATTAFPADRVLVVATSSPCGSPCQTERIRCVTGTLVLLTVYDNPAASSGTVLYTGTLSSGQSAAIPSPIRAINGLRAVFASGSFEFHISQGV